MNIGYQINMPVQRLPQEQLKKFAEIPVSVIGDSMNRTAAVGSEIQPVNGIKLMGSAYTVRVPAGDNLLFYYAISKAQPGDVIAVDGGGFTERALCGEIMAAFAQKRGLAGFVVNGAIRDRMKISQMDFPVFAKASCLNGPYKNGPGEINVPVNIGGRVICPGDIMIGDGNGLVVFKPEDAEEILEEAYSVMEKERHMMEDIEQHGQIDLQWMYQKIKSDQCSFAGREGKNE